MKEDNTRDSKAIACVYFTFSDPDKAYNEGKYMEAKVINTKERTEREET